MLETQHRILIVAFDGLQLAQVTPQLMPNLSALASDGVTFMNHHPVYPSVTRTNVASMVTGCYPGKHGLVANNLVIRDFNPIQSIPALEPELTQVFKTTGRVLLVPTLADILYNNGMEFIAIGTGTSGNAYIQNPNAESKGGVTIHPDFCLPRRLHKELLERFGDWPDKEMTNTPLMEHAVQIMTNYILSERDPTVALIWFSEPDSSQHKQGVGSRMAVNSLRSADEQLGRLLKWLEETNRISDTDILIVSDHGYSTITSVVDIEMELVKAGFPTKGEPHKVIVAPNGGSVLFYSSEKDYSLMNRLTEWLMQQPWCGTLITSKENEIPGTLPAHLIGYEGPRSPELVMSFKWTSAVNSSGFAGHCYSTGGTSDLGQHGSMSRHEMHNVLIATGPSFKKYYQVSNPSGNADITPTILEILGIGRDHSMDGRVLKESLSANRAPDNIKWSTNTHNEQLTTQVGIYRQHLKISRAGKALYIDEGNSHLDG